MNKGKVSSFEFIFLALWLAELYMFRSCSLVEWSSTMRTFNHSHIFNFFHFLFLFCWDLVSSVVFKHGPEGEGLCFPFAHFLLVVSLFRGFFVVWSFGFFILFDDIFDNLFMLTIENSLVLGIELFSFLLEDFVTNGLMFRYTVGIKLSSTSNTTLDKSRGVIFDDILFGLAVGLSDGFFLMLVSWWIIVVIVGLLIELLFS